MKIIISSIFFSAVFLLLQSCNNTKPMSSVASGGSELLFQSQWDLTELQGKPVAISDNQPNLLFFPGQVSRVSGNTGCNKLNGSFTLAAGNIINFSPLLTTKKACIGNNVEAGFLEALGRVKNWRINNNELTLADGKSVVAKLKAVTPESSKLDGVWDLNYISGSKIAFEGLYPDKKPEITFNLASNELGGNTSCNGFGSKISIDGSKISIAEPFSKTMIFCEGGGESTFLNMLKKVNKFAVTGGNTLTFLIGDIAVMRFAKRITGKG